MTMRNNNIIITPNLKADNTCQCIRATIVTERGRREMSPQIYYIGRYIIIIVTENVFSNWVKIGKERRACCSQDCFSTIWLQVLNVERDAVYLLKTYLYNLR